MFDATMCSPYKVRMQSDLSSSDWEEMDWGVMLAGVWMVLLGRPVWVQVLCQLVEAEDCHAFLDNRMLTINFMPMRMNHGSAGSRFLEDVMDGCDALWGEYNVWLAQVNPGDARVAPHVREVHN